MSYICSWMGDRLSSRPGMGCDLVFVSVARLSKILVLMSLMALQLTHVHKNIFLSCFDSDSD